MPHQVVLFFRFFLLAIALTLAGCAGQQPLKPIPPPVYPPPPGEARYIYEGTLRSSHDISEPSFSEKFQAALTGGEIVTEGLAKPYSIAVRKNRLFISDTQQRAIFMFDLENRKTKLFGREGPGSLLKPLGLDISKDDELYVVDITAKRIAVYDLDGNYIRGLGDKTLFVRPTGIAISPDGQKLYVSDTGGIDSDKHRILVLDAKTGELLHTIGKRGEDSAEFNLPLQLSTDTEGNIYIVDSANFRVQGFNPQGKHIVSFGSAGRQPGQFSRPKGITTDLNGNILVVDTAFGNFQIFDPQGKLLLHVGERSTAGGPGLFMLPAGIEVDENGRIYVIDQFFRKVDIFRPLELAPLKGIPTI
ncbi:MAG: 6-bladed beta-propeller [Gammaproteobacteria bacterium]|nr:6-bladed beta-propeller [Gammaproteobacteria bacterium]